MSSLRFRYDDWLGAAIAACDTLIVNRPVDAANRDAQSVLMALAVFQPFILSIVGWLVIPGLAGAQGGMAFTFGGFVAAVLPAGLVSTNRQIALARIAMLAAASCQVAIVVAMAGGVASPMTTLVALSPVLSWLWRRSAADFLAGCVGSLGTVVLAVAIENQFGISQPVSAWHWFVPALLAAMVAQRLVAAPAKGAPISPVALLESLSDVVALRVGFNGDVLEAGDRAGEKLGVDPRQLLSNGLFERIHVADRVGWLSAVADLRTGEDIRSVECRLKTCHPVSGTTEFRPLLAELSRMPTASDEIIVTLRDNHGIVNARASLADATEKAQKLDVAKANFLTSVSHELRTPLNSIIGFSDLILNELAGPLADQRQGEYVRLVRESGRHLLGVVNSILDLSRIESGSYRPELERFSLIETIDLVCAMLKLQAEAKSLHVTLVVGTEMAEICADRRAVQQILINLLSNAIKFSRTRGTITITARRLGSRVHLSVADKGIGIPEDDLRRLGQPFMQVDNDHTRCLEGTGLGLALVKGLVALQHGTLSIESAVGDGTTATVTLPADGRARDNSNEKRVAALPKGESEEGRHGAFRKAG